MDTTVDLDTTDDAFLGGRLRLLQASKGLRAGLDAVFLAAATPVSPTASERILDMAPGAEWSDCVP